MSKREHLVEDALDGQRLDRALEALLPGSGLRHRRRLIEAGRVLVEGRPAPAALRLRAGQRLEVLEQDPASSEPEVSVITGTRAYAALHKPAGLHCASLAGGGGASLEALLPRLLPGVPAVLLNRLDFLTSGIVLAALSPASARAFAALAPGVVLKEYLAVIEGVLDEELTLKRRLDTDDRRRTRVLGKLDPDPRGWTVVRPEAVLSGGRTLVRVRIQAGARHQIRAHLAAAALPIAGDPLYGAGGDAGLYLHHARLEFRGFAASCDPPWLAGLERSADASSQTTQEEA